MRNDSEGTLIKLTKLEIIVGIIVGFIAVGSAVGSWVILPYRVGEAEKAIMTLEVEINRLQQSGEDTRELIVRMDERLKSVQRALRIPTDP